MSQAHFSGMVLTFVKGNGKRYCIPEEELPSFHQARGAGGKGAEARRLGLQPHLCHLLVLTMGRSLVPTGSFTSSVNESSYTHST